MGFFSSRSAFLPPPQLTIELVAPNLLVQERPPHGLIRPVERHSKDRL
jgi:hypothetical protein